MQLDPNIKEHREAVRDLLRRMSYCPDCGGYWPESCSCPDRDDEVAARDEANRDE